MHTEEKVPKRDPFQDEQDRGGVLDRLLVSVRVVASIGAVLLVAYGVFLAVQLFAFLKGMVVEPAGVVAAWQEVMVVERNSSIALEPTSEGAAAAVPAPVVPEAPAIQGDFPAPVVPEVPSIQGDLPGTDTPEMPAAEELLPPSEAPADAPVAPVAAHPVQAKVQQSTDVPPFIEFADRVLDRLETGAYSWLIGIVCLIVFCWLLVKIPVLLITTGSRLLLGLINVESDN